MVGYGHDWGAHLGEIRKEIPFKRFGKKIIRFDRKAIDKWVDLYYDKSYHS